MFYFSNLKWHEIFHITIFFFQKSYREALDAPEFIMTDFAKFETPGQMHVAFKALHQYVETAGALPEARNKVSLATKPLTTSLEFFAKIIRFK